MKNTRLLLAGLLGIALLAVLLLKSMVGSPPPAVQTVAQRMSGQSPLSRTDANGVTWGLDQAGGALDAMDPNGPQAGPPILVKTNVQRVADREVSVGLILEGQAGEQYRPVVKKNGTPVAAPRLRIVSETGQVVTQGDFQYG
jgi:hypothetical protein